MKILLLDPHNLVRTELRDIACATNDITILNDEQAGNFPADSLRIDAIVGVGDFSDRPKLTERLLMWRTHPHTYLVPCWIAADFASFEKVCLWPRLAIDCFDKHFDAQGFSDWLAKVADWQQSRMQLPNSDSFFHHSAIELITCLALRRATGSLLVFDEEGDDGNLVLHEGCLSVANVKHMHEEDAFYEFFAWSQGSYLWEQRESSRARNGRQPLSLLINQGLRLLREANLLYHFLPNLGCIVSKTQSESALDDGGVPFYGSLKEIYKLIDGKLSAAEIIQASPLSRPRTMSCLAKWFSLGDISITAEDQHPVKESIPSLEQAIPPQRLLIVDDSHFMCRALQSIFSQDSRFEIVGVAHDGLEALTLIEQQKPDVVTLDIHMPRMDGLTALKHIMIRNPTPVVVLSSLTKATSHLTYESFKYGAVSVFTKPSRINSPEMEKEVQQLIDAVWQTARVQMEPVQYIRRSKKKKAEQETLELDRLRTSPRNLNGPIVAIGCGTGGFSSLLKLLASITATNTLPFIIACMAMPRRVVEAMAPNLDKDCMVRLEELVDGKPLNRGTCYLYSYDDCFHLTRSESEIKMERNPECLEHVSSFDHLLFSVAEAFGSRTTAMLISGKGADGLDGMRYVKEKGGSTYVLSPAACLSPELPGKILKGGYAKEVKSTMQLAAMLASLGEPALREAAHIGM
jgi:two-component system chemotaxis response regulator CheB